MVGKTHNTTPPTRFLAMLEFGIQELTAPGHIAVAEKAWNLFLECFLPVPVNLISLSIAAIPTW